MSRASPPIADTAALLRQIGISPDLDRLRSVSEHFAAASDDVIEAVLTEASRFAAKRLDRLGSVDDADLPRCVDGRVRTSDLQRSIWGEFADGGWIALDMDERHGGQGLPLILALAVQELFDRSCPAFGMLAVGIRSAVRLLDAFGPPEVRALWLPRLARGEWGATICISEPDAGSDVGRIRTTAVPHGDGSWRISGEKIWISFGDHDLAGRIGHCLLARTTADKGLSLFLVPDRLDDGAPNGVIVRRIEEKLGLHLSPTCALGFEGACGLLLGEEGRGLAQMFVMITNMRMAVGAMGLGIASAAADTALAYARERKQGGRGASPVAIIEHADVRRQLLALCSDVEVLRGLVYATAVQSDLGRLDPDPVRRDEAAALTQWLLPLVKTLGGEVGFNVASGSIQILGGAGYTREWPIEQCLRDARVLTIFEGTTGMQALDLLHRRLWRDRGRGLDLFLARARAEAAGLAAAEASELTAALDWLDQAARRLMALEAAPAEAEAGATALLDLAGLAARGWIAARLCRMEGGDAPASRLRALGSHWLRGLGARAAVSAAAACAGASALAGFDVVTGQ